ncbi:SseB family protein [Vitreimonas flagellata]|uniref:SseB family protein n=1 Tax=Vitreimonas flagellata TaxID=2560861 RepID=UPI00107552BF|nr:SseB family protein [Vitreimonas flagellata]
MQRRSFLIAASAGVAWPVLAWAQQQPSGTTPARPPANTGPRQIEPANDLERAFIAALHDEEARPEFRRLLLDSQVALALQSNLDDAPPRLLALGEGRQAGFVFTSAARLAEVMGPAAPRAVITGREAFERLREKYVILNWRLAPMLTLEPPDVASYLNTAPTEAHPHP